MIDVAARICVGMDVLSRDGEKIGRVAVVWPHMPVSEEGTPPEPWQPVRDPSLTGFFQIDRGGVLGVAGQHWYVPVSEVANLDDDGKVILQCTQAECVERYAERPWFAHIIAG